MTAMGIVMVWNSDTIYALGLYRKIGRIIGIWPLDRTYMRSKIRLAFVMITLMWMCIDFIEQLSVKGNCGTVTEIVDLVSFFTCGCLTVIKLIVLTIYQENVLAIINSAVEDWSGINDQKSRSIMLLYAKTGRKVFIYQALGYCCSTLFLISSRLPSITYLWNDPSNSSVSANGLPLWSSCWLPADISMSDYAVQFILQSFILTVLDACYSSCDSFFFGMAMHLCGQFKVLSTNLRYSYGINGSESHTCHLVEFVKRHQHLLMLSDMLEEAYNLIILIHVGVAAMIICVSGIVLLISLQVPDSSIVGDMMLRIVLTYLQLFMYCYAGEQLATQTTKLKNTIYNCPWYNMSPNSVRSMMLIIMRCDYPFSLTAGNIYNMNFPNFVNIVKTITSYFSVIRLMFKVNH